MGGGEQLIFYIAGCPLHRLLHADSRRGLFTGGGRTAAARAGTSRLRLGHAASAASPIGSPTPPLPHSICAPARLGFLFGTIAGFPGHAPSDGNSRMSDRLLGRRPQYSAPLLDSRGLGGL